VTALYTAGLVARCDQRPIDICESLAEAMAGKVAFVGNQMVMRAWDEASLEAAIATAITLGDDDFAAPIDAVQSGTPREHLFNIVNAKIIDDEQGWKPDVDVPQVAAQEFVTHDGAELPIDVQFEAIHSSAQAQQVAAVKLREARQAMTLTAKFKMRAYPLQLFDVVLLTCSYLGVVSKPFEVLNRKWALGMAIELVLREIDPSIYTFGNTFEAIDPAPNTLLPLPTTVAQLTGLAVESGTAGLSDGSIIARTKVSWTPSTDLAVTQNGTVEVQFRKLIDAITDDWPSVKEQGSAAESTINGLTGGDTYAFRARFINGNGVRGAWSTQLTHLVAAARSVSIGFAALGSNHVIDNNNFTVATIDVDTEGRPTVVFAQLSLQNTSTTISWQQLTFQISDGAGNIKRQYVKTWPRDTSKGTEYDVVSFSFYETSTTAGVKRYQLEAVGAATTNVTILADGGTYITALR
jgi:hypothetical protein